MGAVIFFLESLEGLGGMEKTLLEKLLLQGEGPLVEFKRGVGGAKSDAFESYCAFLNREGGEILLGVRDDGVVEGLPVRSVKDIVKNLICVMNDANLLNPPFCVLPEVVEYEGKKVIRLLVPKSGEVHRFKGVCYDRVDEADVKVTSSDQIAQMYIRKRNIYTEQSLYDDIKLKDLRLDLLPRIRKMACAFRPDHPWRDLSPMELLRSAKLNVYDAVHDAYCFNAAAILLLGKDEVIASHFPAYKTDALLMRADEDRYDDRLVVSTNLIESYDRLMEFGMKWLPDKFYLERDIRVSLRDRILREAIGNLLIHREYSSSRPGRLIIRKGCLFADNANKALQLGQITPQNVCPRPKNPVIADFFHTIGRADELGSGVRNLYKCVRAYSGAEPVFEESDVFTLTIPLDDGYNPEDPGKMGETGRSGRPKQSRLRQEILRTLGMDPRASAQKISEHLGTVTAAQVRNQLAKMRDAGVLRREGPTGNGGIWVVSKSKSKRA